MTILYQFLLALAMYGLARWRCNQTISPDGRNYLIDAWGIPAPSPYNRRWLYGRVFGPSVKAWSIFNAGAIISAAVLCGTLVGCTPFQRVAGTFLFCGLVGAFTINIRFPVLVDAGAMFLALFSAWLWSRGLYFAAFTVVALAGATKEYAPLFAGFYAWVVTGSPLALLLTIGCLAAGWGRKRGKPSKSEPWLVNTTEWARKSRDLFDWRAMLLPWGSLTALIAWAVWWRGWEDTVPLFVTLLIAHLQLFVACDTARLTAWAAPAVIFYGVRAGSPEALLPFLVVHPFISHSYKGV